MMTTIKPLPALVPLTPKLSFEVENATCWRCSKLLWCDAVTRRLCCPSCTSAATAASHTPLSGSQAPPARGSASPTNVFVVTVSQVATYLGKSRSWAHYTMSKGQIESTQVGSEWRTTWEAVEAYVQRRKTTPEESEGE